MRKRQDDSTSSHPKGSALEYLGIKQMPCTGNTTSVLPGEKFMSAGVMITYSLQNYNIAPPSRIFCVDGNLKKITPFVEEKEAVT